MQFSDARVLCDARSYLLPRLGRGGSQPPVGWVEQDQNSCQATACSAGLFDLVDSERVACRRRLRQRRIALARQFPKYFGAIETRMRLSRAINQFLNVRLLVPNNETRSK